MNNDDKLRLIFLAREAEDYDLVRNGFGSFSCLSELKNSFYITPLGIDAFKLRPDDIILLDRKGEILENINNHKISDDLDLHITSYDEREGTVDVVMHINPEHASQRADEGNRIIFLSDCIDPEDDKEGDMAKLIQGPIHHRDYMLIKNNGVLVVGEGIFETLDKAKYIEEIAKIKMQKDEAHDYQLIESHVQSKHD